jgi:uncharacterized protein
MRIRSKVDSKHLAKMEHAILAFVATASAQSLALSLAIGLTGGYRSRWIEFGFLSMLIPSISALVANATVRDRQRPINWGRLPLRYLPLALFIMPLVLHAVMLPAAAAMGRLHWQDWLASSDGLYQTPGALGWVVLTRLGLAVRIAINAITGAIAVSSLALFEEIGWRGWLLPRLIEWAGRRSAVVICSAIWAVWHVPYALSGSQHLYGVPPGWAALGIPVGVFGSGLIIGWLWLRTASIWIVAIAHGALNNWGQYAFRFLSGEGQPRDVLLLVSGGVALIGVGAILLQRLDGRRRTA